MGVLGIKGSLEVFVGVNCGKIGKWRGEGFEIVK